MLVRRSEQTALDGKRVRQLAGLAILIAAAWLFVGVFFASQQRAQTVSQLEDPNQRFIETAGVVMAWALFTPFVIWIAERLPMRKPHLRRNALLLTALAMLSAIAHALVGASIPRLLEAKVISPLAFRQAAVHVFHTNLLIFIAVVATTNLVRVRRETDERMRREAEIEAELAQAQLRRLRSDLQPHFLFNTLNALATLVHTDPDAARIATLKLIELLRRSVDESNRSEVRLAEELDFVRQYLDLQKLRFGDKLRFAIDVRERDLLGARVPPLLLQPLVENSIVHGILRRDGAGGSIEVRAFRENDALRVQIRDDGPGCEVTQPFEGTSIGVPHTRARLEYLYGDPNALWFSRQDRQFVAEVRLPLRGMA